MITMILITFSFSKCYTSNYDLLQVSMYQDVCNVFGKLYFCLFYVNNSINSFNHEASILMNFAIFKDLSALRSLKIPPVHECSIFD